MLLLSFVVLVVYKNFTSINKEYSNSNYYVKYDGNGGTGTTATSMHTYGVPKKLTKNVYTRAFKVTFDYNEGNVYGRIPGGVL